RAASAGQAADDHHLTEERTWAGAAASGLGGVLLVERGEIGAGLKLLGTAFAHVPQNNVVPIFHKI
ncbi:MAG: hypothetical protein QOD93_2582, partial [Acetobacteraceae bacterium]|nr:hypothetical protein [Acetobacteraceae bacterium]